MPVSAWLLVALLGGGGWLWTPDKDLDAMIPVAAAAAGLAAVQAFLAP